MVRTKHNVTITNDMPPTTELHVQAFEARLGYRLPADYREFLLLCNGGHPEPASFIFKDSQRSAVIQFLELTTVEDWAKALTDGLPAGTLPIASATRGILLLGVDRGKRGKIYVSRFPPGPGRAVELVADSFDMLMRKLEEKPPPPPERIETTIQGVKLRLFHPAATEEHLWELESKISRRLPEDYREFLLLHNGGRPEPKSFTFVEDGHDTSSSMQSLYSLSNDEYDALEDNFETFTNRIPSGTIPIGCDGLGNQILLGLHGDIRGKVYFWDHEEEPQNPLDWSNVILVADSFDAFMRGLRP